MNALIKSFFTDLHFTLRLVRKHAAFYAIVLAVLALGIGATTAVSSVVESVLLRPLPYSHPEELTQIWRTQMALGARRRPTSLPDFIDWRAQSKAFTQMAAVEETAVNLSSPGAIPERYAAAAVTGDFFPMLGVKPLSGRVLSPEDDKVGAKPVIVLSADLFRTRFNADPGLVGRSITLDGRAVTVVGVAPEGFSFARVRAGAVDAWLPAATGLEDYARRIDSRGSNSLLVMGRRKEGVSIQEAEADLHAVAARLEQSYPGSNADRNVFLEDLHDSMTREIRSNLWVLVAGIFFVFAILCANLTNLLLIRAQARRAEMSTRAALGATPSRLMRQVVTETVCLFLLGSFGGALLAIELVRRFATDVVGAESAQTLPVSVDVRVLLFSIAGCLVSGLLAGLAPAIVSAHAAPQAVLKDSAARAGVGAAQATVRQALVVLQIGIACVLLIGTGISIKTFSRLARVSPGFDAKNLATANISLSLLKYPTEARSSEFYRRLFDRLRALPEVAAADGNVYLPMGDSNDNGGFSIEGAPAFRPGAEPTMERNYVTEGYFKTMGIPLLRGRDFGPADVKGSRPVLVISKMTADRFFPGEDPVGRRIDWHIDPGPGPHFREIVGVVGDVRKEGLSEEPVPEAYSPFDQGIQPDMGLAIRSSHPEAVLEQLPRIVQEIDPDQPVSSRKLMSERVAESVQSERELAVLLGAFAMGALLLSALGVFGLVSFATRERTREIGIRMSLGATPLQVVTYVFRAGFQLVGVGLVGGVMIAAVLGKFGGDRVGTLLAFDGTVYVAVGSLLAFTASIACLLPAWKAVRIEPAIALQRE